MKRNAIDNLMSYVENGCDKGHQMEINKIELKDNVIYFDGEVKQSRSEGFVSDDYCEINGRVQYITKKSSTIVAIDINYDGRKNNKDYKYGEIVSFEQAIGCDENVILKTSYNKQTKEIKETFYKNYGKDANLLKNYIHNCYNSIPYNQGEHLVQKILKK